MRRLLIFLLTVSLSQGQIILRRPIVIASGAGELASDTFIGTNGTALTSHSANWTLNTGTYEIQSNALEPTAVSANGMASWNAITPNANQYAEVTLGILTGGVGVYLGPAVRIATSGFVGYRCVITSAGDVALQLENGSETTIASSSGHTYTTGDVIRLAISGSSLTCTQNGTTIASGSDGTLTSGRAGISSYNTSGTRITSWRMGNL